MTNLIPHTSTTLALRLKVGDKIWTHDEVVTVIGEKESHTDLFGRDQFKFMCQTAEGRTGYMIYGPTGVVARVVPYLTPEEARDLWASEHCPDIPRAEIEHVIPDLPEGTREYAEYRAKLTEALKAPNAFDFIDDSDLEAR